MHQEGNRDDDNPNRGGILIACLRFLRLTLKSIRAVVLGCIFQREDYLFFFKGLFLENRFKNKQSTTTKNRPIVPASAC